MVERREGCRGSDREDGAPDDQSGPNLKFSNFSSAELRKSILVYTNFQAYAECTERGHRAWRRPRGTPMARRIKTPSDEYLLGTLTWLCVGLIVAAAVTGLFSQLTH